MSVYFKTSRVDFILNCFKIDKLDFPQMLYIVGQEPFLSKSIAYYSDDSKHFPALKEALKADEWEELKNSRLGFYLLQTRTNNFTVKAYSEMFPRWDGDLEDEKADNIVKTMFSSGRAWEQIHWPLVGRKLWTNVKVEIHPMKTEAGQMVRSKKAVSPSRTESEAESRKKARDSPGLDTETMKAEIVRWLTGLTSNMVEGMSRCENTLKSQSRMIKGLTAKMRAVEKIVREGWKEDQTKAGSSTDVPEANKSDGDKAKEDRAEESKAKESKAEESKAAVTSPKPIRMTRAKAKDAQATVSESENENGGISVVVMDKEQSNIDYCSVKKLKQVGKLRAARIVARAKSERQRRLAATHHSPFDGNSTAKVIIPNQSKRGQGYNPFASVDHQKLFVLLDWVKLDLKWRQKVPGSSSFWFYTLLTPTKWLSDTMATEIFDETSINGTEKHLYKHLGVYD
ncbi:hypothetical protein HID58_088369 [Brassica napus]|uniref:Uncharacterized protein n=1 Tax=Brassica napus TaxID=3708 RepID=A0ABQ7XW00_BRANA|nr:hypothetical protein HID58_088369 [Brassica napus]